jgi:hypothetical protein
MVVAGSEPVTAQLRSRAWLVLGGSNRYREGNRERFASMIGHGDALPVGDLLCDPAFRRALSASVMTCRS